MTWSGTGGGGRGRKHAMNKSVQRANTRGLSGGEFTIDLHGKQMSDGATELASSAEEKSSATGLFPDRQI